MINMYLVTLIYFEGDCQAVLRGHRPVPGTSVVSPPTKTGLQVIPVPRLVALALLCSHLVRLEAARLCYNPIHPAPD